MAAMLSRPQCVNTSFVDMSFIAAVSWMGVVASVMYFFGRVTGVWIIDPKVSGPQFTARPDVFF